MFFISSNPDSHCRQEIAQGIYTKFPEFHINMELALFSAWRTRESIVNTTAWRGKGWSDLSIMRDGKACCVETFNAIDFIKYYA